MMNFKIKIIQSWDLDQECKKYIFLQVYIFKFNVNPCEYSAFCFPCDIQTYSHSAPALLCFGAEGSDEQLSWAHQINLLFTLVVIVSDVD